MQTDSCDAIVTQQMQIQYQNNTQPNTKFLYKELESNKVVAKAET